MRKNYFAKKFVAYTMAFAVAFSTVTVSPLFVKDAKAAGKAVHVTTAADATASITTPIDNGVSILGTVKTSESPSTVTFADIKGDFGNGTLINPGVTAAKVPGTLNYEDLTITTSHLSSYKGGQTSVSTATTGKTKKVIFNDKQTDTELNAGANANWYQLSEPIEKTFVINEGKATEETITYTYYTLSQVDSAKQKLELGKVTASSTGYYLADLGTGNGYDLYNVVEDTDLTVTPERQVSKGDTYKVVEGGKVDLKVNATTNKSSLSYTWKKGSEVLKSTDNVCTIENVDGTKKGTYTCIVTDGVKTITTTDIKVDVLGYTDYYGASPIEYTSVAKALIPTSDGANAGKISGGSVTLTSAVPASEEYVSVWLDGSGNVIERSESDIASYNASNNKATLTSKNVYTGKEIKCYTILKADYDEELAEALKEVNKAITEVSKFSKITELLKAEKKAVITDTSLDAISIETFKLLGTDDKTYTSENVVKSVGESVDVSAEAITLDEDDVVYYDGGIGNFAKTALQGDEFGTKTFVTDKYVKVEDKSEYVATEIYYVRSGNTFTATPYANQAALGAALDAKDEVYKRVNDNPTYSDTDENTYIEGAKYYEENSAEPGNYKEYALTGSYATNGETLTGTDLSKTLYTLSTPRKYTNKLIKYVNVVYTPDLKVSTNDVTAKIGEKINLSVTADSKLPLDYTWTDKNMESTIKAKDSTKNKNITADITVQDGDIYQPEVRNADDEVVTNEDHYVTCEVTNGIETKSVKIRINQLGGFSYVDNSGAVKKSTEATGADTVFTVKGIAGKDVKLAPVVKANEGTELTYAWYKSATPGTTPVSTEPTLTTSYSVSSSTNKFSCVVADKAAPKNKVVFVYTVNDTNLNANAVKIEKIDAQVYTGKTIEPELSVKIDADFVGELVKGTDYFAKFENNINAGTARVEVTFSKELDPTQAVKVEATFPIDKAENKLELANTTSATPKVVNNDADAPLTFTYFSDAAGKNKIAAPTAAGVYYVQAKAVATANYNAAVSNIAKVVIAPAVAKNFKLAARGTTALKASWTKVAGAKGYRVYKVVNGKWTRVAETANNYYTFSNLKAGTTYKFAVKPYLKDGSTPVWAKTYTALTAFTKPGKVAGFKVAAKTRTTVKTTWKKTTGATSYNVYKVVGKKWVKVATVKGTSYTFKGLKKNTTYKFAVKAYKSGVAAASYPTLTTKTAK